MNSTKISNVYLDMVEKAYSHLVGFNCGYDHKRSAIYSPATSSCSINIYGIFSEDTDLSKTINGMQGSYLMWKSADTNKPLKIEDCLIHEDSPPKLTDLINIKEYMESMDSPEKKLLASKMMVESSLYWINDNWYTAEAAYLRMNEIESTAMDYLDNLPLDECDLFDGEDEDYDYEFVSGTDDTMEDDYDDGIVELSDISDAEYKRVIAALEKWTTAKKITTNK